MKTICALGTLICFFVRCDDIALAQTESDATTSQRWMRDANFTFSLSKHEDVERIRVVRDIAVLEATLALEKLARKEFSSDDEEPIRAAKVLLMHGGGG